MEYSKLQDKCRGSLVGGAVGDALGYEVEFLSLPAIHKRFGEGGITRYVLDRKGVARFSDDTQMTLFTLEGLMNGAVATKVRKAEKLMPYIEYAYLNWYKTQTSRPKPCPDSWLSHIRTLWDRRAPGMTCMGALDNLNRGMEVKNGSKGCGGVMRVAPIGIFGAAHPDFYTQDDIAKLAGEAAEITHTHIASTFASAMLAFTVERCILEESVDRKGFVAIVEEGLEKLEEWYPGHFGELRRFRNIIRRALELGESDVPEIDAIGELGGGWLGDEAFAIAVFCVLRHIDNFEKCIICAVNHAGDSDSTGSITGNIIGGILGYSAIPKFYLENLEIVPLIVSAADDLCADIKVQADHRRIINRYRKHLPVETGDIELLKASK